MWSSTRSPAICQKHGTVAPFSVAHFSIKTCMGKRGDTGEKGKFSESWGILSPGSMSETDSCSGIQESNFSASVSISVLREYNNTYWPTSQGCGEAFSLQSTQKRKSLSIIIRLVLVSSLVPRPLRWGWRWSLEMTFRGSFFSCHFRKTIRN